MGRVRKLLEQKGVTLTQEEWRKPIANTSFGAMSDRPKPASRVRDMLARKGITLGDEERGGTAQSRVTEEGNAEYTKENADEPVRTESAVMAGEFGKKNFNNNRTVGTFSDEKEYTWFGREAPLDVKTQLAQLEHQKSELEAGLDLDGAAALYNNEIVPLRQQIKAQERADAAAQAANVQRAKLDSYNALSGAGDFAELAAKGAAKVNEKTGAYGDIPGNIVRYYRQYDHPLYRTMTEQEVSVYDYLLGKGDEAGAQEYLETLNEELRRRQGIAKAQEIQNIENPGKQFLAYAGQAVGSGLDKAVQGVAQMFTEERLPTSASQFTSEALIEDLSDIGKYAYMAANTVGNMLPSIVVGTLTGGVGGVAVQGFSAAGNAYNQALEEGYGKDEAKTYAMLIGASEATLQYLLGGISKLGGVNSNVLLAKVKSIDNVLARLALTGGVKIGSEIGEEELQLWLEPAIRSLVFDESYDAPSFEEMVETAIVTILSTGMTEGGDAVLSNVEKTGGKAWNGMKRSTTDRTDVPTGMVSGDGVGAQNGTGLHMAGKETQDMQPVAEQKTGNRASGAETTSIDADPASHTMEENERIRNYLQATNDGLAEWVKRVRAAFSAGDKTAAKMKKVLGEVKENTAKAIQSACGVDVTGFKHMIDGAAIQHIDIRHGMAGEADDSMTAAEDIARVEYVLNHFDGYEQAKTPDGEPDYSAQFRDRNNRPAPMVRFYKRVDGTYYVVEAVPDSADCKLHIVSACMTKNGGSIIQELNMEESSSLQPTPEAPLGPVASADSKYNITKLANSVNFGEPESGQSDATERNLFVKGLFDGVERESAQEAGSNAADTHAEAKTAQEKNSYAQTSNVASEVRQESSEHNVENGHKGQVFLENENKQGYTETKGNGETAAVDYESFARRYRERVNNRAAQEEIRAAYERFCADTQVITVGGNPVPRAQPQDLIRKLDRGAALSDNQRNSFSDQSQEKATQRTDAPDEERHAEEITPALEIKRVSEIKVEFTLNPKHDEQEFSRQLSDQEKGMNELTIQEYLDNRKEYKKQKRTLKDRAARNSARKRALAEKVIELQNDGTPKQDAMIQAEAWLKTQAALHSPDQVAGGYADNVIGVGDKRVNSSIGAQWRYRIDAVDRQVQALAESMSEGERKSTYLNMKLMYGGK